MLFREYAYNRLGSNRKEIYIIFLLRRIYCNEFYNGVLESRMGQFLDEIWRERQYASSLPHYH